mgnify:CR=1 FL=1
MKRQRLTVTITTPVASDQHPPPIHVSWTGDVSGSCSIERDQGFTWDYVRKYINDNCFADGAKPGTANIRVRFFHARLTVG